jgi:hypothetical protein
MSVHKLVQSNSNGTKQEYAGLNASAGAGSAGEFIIADAGGKLDPTFLPNGVGADAITATAGEALSAGDFVYINGTGNAVKADATAIGKKAHGYVLAAVANAASATIYFDESNNGLTGLTPGATYYLSATAGAATTTAPTTSGQIVQTLGVATSATSLHVNIEQQPVTRA